MHFIRDEVDKVYALTMMAHGAVGRPATDKGVLAKILLFVELFRIPERKAEGWVLVIGPHLGIWQRIDDRVIGKAYAKRGVRSILHAESFHSSIKRIFGIVTKRLGVAINTQVLRRIIHNNRRKTDYYLMADPEFIGN